MLEDIVCSLFYAVLIVILDLLDFFSSFEPIQKITQVLEINRPSIIFFLILILLIVIILFCAHLIITNKKFAIRGIIISILLFIWCWITDLYSYKTIICIIAFIGFGSRLLYDAYAYYKNRKKKPTQPTIISLANLYRGNIPKGSPILLEDTEVNDDIYNRNQIINQLCNIIKSNLSEKNFTVSLTGEWGSGKSTIIKCAKKQIQDDEKITNDIIIIDDFEPWLYSDNTTMAKELANTIFKKFNYKTNSRLLNDLANNLLNITPNTNIVSSITKLFLAHQEDASKIIEDYLSKRNKKLVLIIDNLERCEPELIITILKMLKNSLSIKNTITILSYDNEMLTKILSDRQIDLKYLEKFSQMTISVPAMLSTDHEKIVSKCVENYFGNFDNNLSDRDKRELSNYIAMSTQTPRQLLLEINSIYASACDFLNPLDSFILNIIARETSTLYSFIQEHEYEFVYDESIIRTIETSSNTADGQKRIKKYHDDKRDFFCKALQDPSLKKDIESHMVPLKYLFPNIVMFLEKPGINYQDNLFFSLMNKEELEKTAYNEKRLRDASFFPYYFARTRDGFIRAINTVDAFTEEQSASNCKNLFEKINSSQDITFQTHTFERLSENVDADKFKPGTIKSILNESIHNFSTLPNTSQTQLCRLLSKVIQKIDEKTFKETKGTLLANYRNFKLLFSLKKWGELYEPNNARINVIYEEMRANILNKKINIYTKQIFERYFIRYLGDKDRKTIIKYIKEIKPHVKKREQILILTDFILQEKAPISKNSYAYIIDGYPLLNDVFTDDEIVSIIKNAKKSRLKDLVKEIIDSATEEPYYPEKRRSCVIDNSGDISEIISEYINAL